eukprot:SAG31_NODE_2365_length_5859_cov_22.319097_1_plen_55_part_00
MPTKNTLDKHTKHQVAKVWVCDAIVKLMLAENDLDCLDALAKISEMVHEFKIKP